MRPTLPPLFGFALSATVRDGVQELPNVASAKVGGASLQDHFKGAPQSALDLFCGAQATNNPPPKIEIDQLLDRNSRFGRLSGLALIRDQVTAAAGRAGQFVGLLARLLEADIGRASER